MLDSGSIRFFGNVHFGRDITLKDLQENYHAVIFATGAIADADLPIPGITADYSFGAADFVSWFDGHPDVPRSWQLDAREVAVVGNGNVALDISRMLVKHPEDLEATEIPDNVLEGLRANKIETLHIFGRRSPWQVKFTPLELRELGEVRDVDMVLDPLDLEYTDEHLEGLKQSNKQVLVISRIFDKWLSEQGSRAQSEQAGSRRIVFHFWTKPVEVIKDEHGRVSGIKIQRTKPDGKGGVIDTDEFKTVPVQALYRAVGYFGSELADIPFDGARGVLPNDSGRVLDAQGAAITGVYATGWIKRGPVGLIGATKSDARETLDALLIDWQLQRVWQPLNRHDPQNIVSLLESRGVDYTDLEGWHLLDAAERARGARDGRERIKIVPREEMVNISSVRGRG